MRSFLFLSLVLLSACTATPTEELLVLGNDGDDVHYVNGTEFAGSFSLTEEVDGEFVSVVPGGNCTRRCGVAPAPLGCGGAPFGAGDTMLVRAVPEMSVVWAIQPGDELSVSLPDEPRTISSDAFGQCVRRTDLSGELRASLCHSDSFSSDLPIDTPTETGPVDDPFENASFLDGADCSGLAVERDGFQVRASLNGGGVG